MPSPTDNAREARRTDDKPRAGTLQTSRKARASGKTRTSRTTGRDGRRRTRPFSRSSTIRSVWATDILFSTIRANARFFEKEEDVPTTAITMGMLSIMQAKKVLLVANGPKKKDIVEKSFFGLCQVWINSKIYSSNPICVLCNINR